MIAKNLTENMSSDETEWRPQEASIKAHFSVLNTIIYV